MGDGEKMILMVDDVPIATSEAETITLSADDLASSMAWEELISKSSEYAMIYDPPITSGTFEYYCRRGDKYFFRSAKGKMVFETSDRETMQDMKLRYGLTVVMEWE